MWDQSITVLTRIGKRRCSAVSRILEMLLGLALVTLLGSLGVDGNVDSSPLMWKNGPVDPSNSTSPYSGARWMYRRTDMGTPGTTGTPPRSSPFDLNVTVYDSGNASIQHRAEVARVVDKAVSVVHFWDPKDWRSQFADGGFSNATSQAILTNKSHFFWEQLAEQLAWLVLRPPGAAPPASAVYLFGPECVTGASGTLKPSCASQGAPNASRVTITTMVSGARDDLMPVSRIISLHVQRSPYQVYDVEYTVAVPGVTHVASPWRETLDMRPKVNGQSITEAMKFHFRSPLGRRFYPDYNLMFLPMRHLVLQGSILDPKVLPGSSMQYDSLEGLQAAASSVVKEMQHPSTAAKVAQRMAPYFNHRYYYMFDYFNYSTGGDSIGVSAYKKQTLGPGGQIPLSYMGTVAEPKLLIGENVFPLDNMPACTPPSHPDDCAALLSLNASVTMGGGALYGPSATTICVCEWLGVTCDSKTGRVKTLDLHNRGLAGPIPEGIARLTEVEKLYLWANELTGSIPYSLGSLASVTDLVLEENLLTGTLPASLGKLKALSYLGFAFNKLEGSIPAEYGGLESLTFLKGDYNQLGGALPDSLGGAYKIAVSHSGLQSVCRTYPTNTWKSD